MDMYATFWLLIGATIGGFIGFGLHAIFMKRYLRKHMKDHPEYRVFHDVIEGKIPNKEEDKGGDK